MYGCGTPIAMAVLTIGARCSMNKDVRLIEQAWFNFFGFHQFIAVMQMTKIRPCDCQFLLPREQWLGELPCMDFLDASG